MIFLKKCLKNKYILGSLLTLIIVCIIILVFVKRSEKAQAAIIIAKIEKSSELTTAKITFTGMSEFKDKGIYNNICKFLFYWLDLNHIINFLFRLQVSRSGTA